MKLITFLYRCTLLNFKGNKIYWSWISSLVGLVLIGIWFYAGQLQNGLIQTGMSDQVSWGFYIANFTYLVGIAAAAVMLVVPAYIFHHKGAKEVVILGEGLAVAASLMCMLFVTVDMGRPDRLWHILPGIGLFNWPHSLLTWDVLVLNGYLALNLFMPLYILYHKFHKTEYNKQLVFAGAVVSMFWAISIHTVTAFLFSSNAGRPFWHIALLAPRFITSAFTAGPAFIILAFLLVRKFSAFRPPDNIFKLLAIIVTVAMQINLFMLGAEVFTEFYSETAHSASAHYLFFGLHGLNGLVPWIYTAITLNVSAVLLLMIHKTRENPKTLALACAMAVIGVWLEKGMGFVIPGFIPTPLGEIFEYLPSVTEVFVTIGIWAIGMIAFTFLVKPAIAIQNGDI